MISVYDIVIRYYYTISHIRNKLVYDIVLRYRMRYRKIDIVYDIIYDVVYDIVQNRTVGIIFVIVLRYRNTIFFYSISYTITFYRIRYHSQNTISYVSTIQMYMPLLYTNP